MSFADFHGDLRSRSGSTRETHDAACLKHEYLAECCKPDYLGPFGPGTRASVELKKAELNLLSARFRLKSWNRAYPLYLKRRGFDQLILRCSARPRDRR